MRLKLKWKIVFSIILFIIISFILLKYIGNIGITIREYKVNSSNNPIYGFKIVQFSDIYYGKTNERKLNKLVTDINKTKPDIVIFSGDLIYKDDISNNELKIITKYLSDINSTYGKFYVTGELDNNKNFVDIMNNSNFESLDKNYKIIESKNGNIFITGIDSNKSLDSSIIENMDSNNYNYKIFVSHYPDKIVDILKYNFDLILCSHSLNGQVKLPVIGSVFKFSNAKKYYDEYYKEKNSDIYITGGIGNKIIDIRLFNKPSFNLYRLVNS